MLRLLFPLVVLIAWFLLAPPVHAQNTPPVAQPDTVTVEAGELVNLDVLANDTDADGDALRIDRALTPMPRQGQASIVTTETTDIILYFSDEDATEADSFFYRVTDGQGGTDDALVWIVIIQNDPPVAQADTTHLFAHEVVEIDVLANDSDPEGDPITITRLPEGPHHGIALIVTDSTGQRIRYDPDDAFAGQDSLVYEIADSLGHPATATVRLEIALNQPPTAVNDSLNILIGMTTDIDVLANDLDAEGDTLFIRNITAQPGHGAVEIIDDRTRLRYTPTPGFLGEDQFAYSLSDGIPRAIDDDYQATVIVQVLPPDDTFEAVLSGAHVVPPVATRASGSVRATLTGTTLAISGVFSGLGADFSPAQGARIQIGLVGQNGDLLLPLVVTPGSNNRSGSLARETNTFTLPTEAIAALFARQLYVTIRSEPFGEELRGQLLPTGSSVIVRAAFSGRAVLPATSTEAVGGAVAERFGNTLIVTGTFSGLDADLLQNAPSVRLHQGLIGGDGNVLFPLTVTPHADRRGGTLALQDNQFVLTNEQTQLLDNGLTYITIYTQDNPEQGTLRGQLFPFSSRMFEVTLAGRNEAPLTESDGTGGLMVTVDGLTLSVSGLFSGLSANVDLTLRNGVHLHQAAPDANGPILFELAPLLNPDRRSGAFANGANQFTLSPSDLNALFDGNLYVNIHTTAYPDGEVRGQVLPSPNVAPDEALLVHPANGALLDLSGDPLTPFSVTWQPASDANRNTVYYRWQLASDAAFNTVFFTSDLTTETTLTTTAGVIDAALATAGIAPNATVTLHHRLLATDGARVRFGAAVLANVTRGLATATEETTALPERFAVLGNFPNPFNPTTTLHVDLPHAARVQVVVYDLLGRRVLTTPPRLLEAGPTRAVPLDAAALPSGLYVYRVVAEAGAGTVTGVGRMTVLR